MFRRKKNFDCKSPMKCPIYLAAIENLNFFLSKNIYLFVFLTSSRDNKIDNSGSHLLTEPLEFKKMRREDHLTLHVKYIPSPLNRECEFLFSFCRLNVDSSEECEEKMASLCQCGLLALQELHLTNKLPIVRELLMREKAESLSQVRINIIFLENSITINYYPLSFSRK